jgi:IclR family acetate operon transcriptional repressor
MDFRKPLGDAAHRPPAKKAFEYTIASVDRAIELLLLLESASRDMGVTELAKLLGVQKSTVHNLIQTLMARDFVRQTDSGRFTLGFRLMRLGTAASELLDIRRIADPILRELASVANEYVLLAVLNREEVTIIDSVAPQRSTFIVPRIDFAHTFHCTALGKIFLAYGSDQIRKAILSSPLSRYTPYTLVSEKTVAEEIDRIHRQGFAVSCNETIEGVTCIGAPIFNAHGKLEAAVSISSSTARLTVDKYQEMADILTEKSAAISKMIGF